LLLLAGVIGAVGNNGKGGAGVSWASKLMAIKVGNATSIYLASVMKGVSAQQPAALLSLGNECACSPAALPSHSRMLQALQGCIPAP
jgi:hypothetical protein